MNNFPEAFKNLKTVKMNSRGQIGQLYRRGTRKINSQKALKALKHNRSEDKGMETRSFHKVNRMKSHSKGR